MNSQEAKADIARNYPIEEQLTLFMTKCVWGVDNPTDLPRRLRVGRYLADKALVILADEMDVRGAQSVLQAIARVEETRNDIDDCLAALEQANE